MQWEGPTVRESDRAQVLRSRGVAAVLAIVLALLSPMITAGVASAGAPPAGIDFDLTAGTDPAICGTANELVVPAGTRVIYCYEVTNNAGVTLTSHDLTDDQLGVLLNNFPYALAPGASAFLTDSAVLTPTTTNVATWTASNIDTSFSDTDSLTVTVTPPAISLDKTVGTDPNICAATDTVNVPAGTEVTYCYEVTNTGDTTLPRHDLADDQLGTILNNFPYSLAPGASAFITQGAVIATDTTNVATWTAYDPDLDVSATASDTVTVTVDGEPTTTTTSTTAPTSSSSSSSSTSTSSTTTSTSTSTSTTTSTSTSTSTTSTTSTTAPTSTSAPTSTTSSTTSTTGPTSTSSSTSSTAPETTSTTAAPEPTTTEGPGPTDPSTSPPPTGPSIQIAPSTIVLGGVATVSGTGCDPGATVSITLGGRPLATTTASDSGSWTASITAPTDATAGSYDLTASCGSTSATLTLVLSSTGQLPATGADEPSRLLLPATMLVVLGLALTGLSGRATRHPRRSRA